MSKEITPAQSAAIDKLENLLDVFPRVTDPDEVMLAITMRIAAAETADEVLAEVGETDGFRDLTGKRLRVFGAHRMESTVSEDGGEYLVIDAQDMESGQALAITCGSLPVMVQIAKLAQLGKLPCEVTAYEIQSKSNPGRSTLRLRAAEVAF